MRNGNAHRYEILAALVKKFAGRDVTLIQINGALFHMTVVHYRHITEILNPALTENKGRQRTSSLNRRDLVFSRLSVLSYKLSM